MPLRSCFPALLEDLEQHLHHMCDLLINQVSSMKFQQLEGKYDDLLNLNRTIWIRFSSRHAICQL